MFRYQSSFALLFAALLLFQEQVAGLAVVRQQQATAQVMDRRALLQKATASLGVFGVAAAAATLSPQPVLAYERRDVGGENPSALTSAMNEQAYQTNNRLEAQGFKLDTPEDEKARLSAAMSSFSYDSFSSPSSTGKSKSGPKSKQQSSK
eukprot:CAMPEP_0198147142 /NCGR_PEP_ID=MMETSP1443-20131203/33382_1 /TAXON_ID=186043 /ORGANISM="Entomoneis sp., Strain CCMP2396" /LENGTH=149 /DNA_ID=CAMNT_0043811317 /DNA_START=72 /DNA_END=521 /DNA_ORIENTATION=+